MTDDGERLGLEHFFENSLDLMTVSGRDGFFKALNPAWTEVTGWGRDELKAQPMVGFVHPDDVESTLSQRAEIFRGGRAIAFENRFRCRDGTYRWLQWNAMPRGDVVYAVARDVTETKDVEASLRRSERFLESIVEHIPNMVFVKEAAELRFVSMNRAGEDLLGSSRQDLVGKSDFDFFPDEEAAFFVSTDREVLAGGEMVDVPAEPIETRFRGERILHTKKIPIPGDHGEPAFLLGISEDITDYIRGQGLLRQRQETLDAVFTSSPDAILTLDRELAVQDVSSAIESVGGVSATDLRGERVLAMVHPDDRTALGDALEALVAQESDHMDVRCRVGHAEGHWVPVEARGRALRDDTGESSGVVVVLRDITESLAAQEALQKAQRSEAEHELVEDLQRRAIHPPPSTAGLEIAGHYESARSVVGMGGDWYQGMTLDNGRLGLIVGDAVGHGLGAAGDMTQLSGMLATLLRVGTPLEELFTVLHSAAGPLGIMATVAVCEVDPIARTIRHVSAGHPPVVIAAADGTSTFLTGGRRPPVGVPGDSVSVAVTPLPIGSTLFAYTDGLLERRDESFDVGMARLQRALATTCAHDVDAQLAEVVRRCTEDHVTEDDIAVVAVRSVPG